MSEKQCRKCGHTTSYSGMEPMSCMECGAIYRKVDEALRAAEEVAARAQTQTQTQADARAQAQTDAREEAAARAQAAQSNLQFAASALDAGDDVHAFAQHMRNDSLYPVWRKLVAIATVLVYAVAAVALLGAVIALFKGSITMGLSGMFGAIIVVVLARAGKEVSLMLADLSDASMRAAARASSDRS